MTDQQKDSKLVSTTSYSSSLSGGGIRGVANIHTLRSSSSPDIDLSSFFQTNHLRGSGSIVEKSLGGDGRPRTLPQASGDSRSLESSSCFKSCLRRVKSRQQCNDAKNKKQCLKRRKYFLSEKTRCGCKGVNCRKVCDPSYENIFSQNELSICHCEQVPKGLPFRPGGVRQDCFRYRYEVAATSTRNSNIAWRVYQRDEDLDTGTFEVVPANEYADGTFSIGPFGSETTCLRAFKGLGSEFGTKNNFKNDVSVVEVKEKLEPNPSWYCYVFPCKDVATVVSQDVLASLSLEYSRSRDMTTDMLKNTCFEPNDGHNGEKFCGEEVTNTEEENMLALYKVWWDSGNGGVGIDYQVLGQIPLANDGTISLYWAAGQRMADVIGDPFGSLVVPAGTSKGWHGGSFVPVTSLAPEGTTHVLAVSGTETMALRDVNVQAGGNVDLNLVTPLMISIIKGGLRASGTPTAMITSTVRSPEDQARAMFDNLLRTGVAAQLDIYAAPGDAVIRVYQRATSGLTRGQILSMSSSIQSEMTTEIYSQGPSNVSRHCGDPSKMSIVDVGTALLPNNSRFANFVSPLIKTYPGGDFLDERRVNGCYHLELQVGSSLEPPSGGSTSTTTPTTPSSIVEIRKMEMTQIGENFVDKVYWLDEGDSGVTLAWGYDMGNKSPAEVKSVWRAAGMSAKQSFHLSRGAGLKMPEAKEWVENYGVRVGTIDRSVGDNVLKVTLQEFRAEAKKIATSTYPTKNANDEYTNARGREVKEGKPLYTYVMTESQWNSLHPAMIELITDMKYQGGYYLWDRVARVNERLIANDGDHLAQFRAIATLFGNPPSASGVSYMDDYCLGWTKPCSLGNTEVFFGVSAADIVGASERRNRIRLSFLMKVIRALEAGNEVILV